MKTAVHTPKTLLVPLDHILKRKPDVVIIGSGPAGVAVAEYMFNVFPEATIAIIERGDVLTLTHVGNVFPDEDKTAFVLAHGTWPWKKGYFAGNGLMMYALGGRGIVAGGLLRRFDREDFDLWEGGNWPVTRSELDPFYTVAEIVRKVSPGECESPAQTWVMGSLDEFNPHPPPWGIDVRSSGSRRLLDSSVQRLCELIHRDYVQSFATQGQRRLLVTTNTLVTSLAVEGGKVTRLKCRQGETAAVLKTVNCTVILAASPIESARLILNSKMDSKLGLPATGKYLAEHILSRTSVVTSFPVPNAGEARVNVFVPALHLRDKKQRFQIDVRHDITPIKDGKLQVRISGFAAMDPNPNNRMVLEGREVNTVVKPSKFDDERVQLMEKKMIQIAKHLGARVIPKPVVARGRSNHEVGTLRMGYEEKGMEKYCVTDAKGRVHGVENLFVGDASVFPCVGVANPMLTITALAYRLGKHVGRKMNLVEEKDLKPPWSLC